MLQSVTDMALELSQEKTASGHNKLYKAQADEHRAEIMKHDIQQGITALRHTVQRGKVSLNDYDLVKQRTEEYFEACAISGTFPSMMGLSARAFGVSRQAVNQFINNNPHHKTSEYLLIVKDLIADILVDESLKNNANPVQVIFQLKNHFGHQDKVEIQPVMNEDPLLAGLSTPEEIKQRYMESVCPD